MMRYLWVRETDAWDLVQNDWGWLGVHERLTVGVQQSREDSQQMVAVSLDQVSKLNRWFTESVLKYLKYCENSTPCTILILHVFEITREKC